MNRVGDTAPSNQHAGPKIRAEYPATRGARSGEPPETAEMSLMPGSFACCDPHRNRMQRQFPTNFSPSRFSFNWASAGLSPSQIFSSAL